MVFNKNNGILSATTEQELLQMLVQHELQRKQWYAAAPQRRTAMRAKRNQNAGQWCGLKRKIDGERVYLCEERQLDEGRVNEEKTPEGGNDHLLILARSAELLLESEDTIHKACRNDQIHEGSCTTSLAQSCEEIVSNATVTGQKSFGTGNKVDGIHARAAHEKSEKERFPCKEKTLRLSQIRCQARLKNQPLTLERIGKYTCEHFQGRATRLTQIRHQARSINYALLQKRTGDCSHGHFQGRMTRLIQVRRQARSKNNLLVQEEIGKAMNGSLHWHTYEDNHKDQVAAKQCEKEDSCQVAVQVRTEDKMMHVKGRIRLSQLRREARLGNAHFVAQGHAERLDRARRADVIL